MSKPFISMIFAMDRNQLIGKDNELPWYIPEDLAYFKRTTVNHSIIMGRKTYDSFGCKPLPNRNNIILTRNKEFKATGCTVVYSVKEALGLLGDEETFVIGGSEVYKLFLPIAQKLYITHIDAEFIGDAYFPEIDEEKWKVESSIQGIHNDKNPYDYVYKIYKRI